MDLLARFIHVERPTQGTPATRRAAERVIFPRFHQWDAVLALEADARERGAGHSYLIEHSAGFKRILDDEEFCRVLMDLYASRVYQRARRDP